MKTNTPTIKKKIKRRTALCKLKWRELEGGVWATYDICVAQNGAKYQAFIIESENLIKIKNIEARRYIEFNRTGKRTNLRALKKFAKLELKKLGVRFEFEIRPARERKKFEL